MRSLTLALIAAVCLLPACGEDETGTISGSDTLFGEVLFPDTEQADTAVEDTSFTGSLPGDFGQGCRDNRDCETGWCVEGPDGFVCSRTCVDSCPDGWGCKGITSGSVDLVFVCVPDGDDPEPDTVMPDTFVPDTFEGDTSVLPDTTPPVDTVQPPVGSLCDLDPGVGTETFFAEGNDWGDCLTGCNNAALIGFNEINLGGPGNSAGALGVLDGEDHDYPVGLGPDIDILPLRAEPRTMLEIAVQAGSAGALIDPVVYISDSFQVRTFNSDVSPDNSCARTTIAFPFLGAQPIFVAVEDAINYDAWTPNGYGATVGGTAYAYTIRVRSTPFAPVELGNVAAGNSLSATGQALTLGGETKYYRFQAPANSTPRVRITRTGSTSFVPALGVFKSDQNQMVWQATAWDSDGNGVSELTGGFITCFEDCGSAPVDHFFAVYDWNGAAGPGAFTYDVNIQL